MINKGALKPKLDYNNPAYPAFEQAYDEINRLYDLIDSIQIKEYIVKSDPTSKIPFSNNDNKLPSRRIVIYENNVYEFIKTSNGWKYHALS